MFVIVIVDSTAGRDLIEAPAVLRNEDDTNENLFGQVATCFSNLEEDVLFADDMSVFDIADPAAAKDASVTHYVKAIDVDPTDDCFMYDGYEIFEIGKDAPDYKIMAFHSRLIV